MPGLKILRKERAQEMKGKRARIWPAGSQLLLAMYNPMLFLGSQVQSGISKVHIPRILQKKKLQNFMSKIKNEKVTIFNISLFCDTKDHWEPAGSFPVCATATATCSFAKSRVPKQPHSQQPRGDMGWRCLCPRGSLCDSPWLGGGSSPSYFDHGANEGDRSYFLRKCSSALRGRVGACLTKHGAAPELGKQGEGASHVPLF